jgi:hypothetical protein
MSGKKLSRADKVAQLLDILKKDAPRRAEFARKCTDLDAQNASTIAMLQKRVLLRFEDVVLPGGDRVPIRPALSQAEDSRLEELRREYLTIVDLTPDEKAREDALRSELVGIRMRTPEEIRRVREISTELDSLGELSEDEKASVRDIDYEIVEIITLDDELTAAWLKTHPEAFSQEDLLWIINGFRAQQIRQSRERQERIAAARSFHGNPVGN